MAPTHNLRRPHSMGHITIPIAARMHAGHPHPKDPTATVTDLGTNLLPLKIIRHLRILRKHDDLPYRAMCLPLCHLVAHDRRIRACRQSPCPLVLQALDLLLPMRESTAAKAAVSTALTAAIARRRMVKGSTPRIPHSHCELLRHSGHTRAILIFRLPGIAGPLGMELTRIRCMAIRPMRVKGRGRTPEQCIPGISRISLQDEG